MASQLVSGPAGGGKSQTVAALRRAATVPTIVADFTALYVALTGDVRGPDGRYPLRDERLLQITEALRREVIDLALRFELDVLATNSDGAQARRDELLRRLGPDATERVIDPGREVVEGRLADPVTGQLSPECATATDRWYGRIA